MHGAANDPLEPTSILDAHSANFIVEHNTVLPSHMNTAIFFPHILKSLKQKLSFLCPTAVLWKK